MPNKHLPRSHRWPVLALALSLAYVANAASVVVGYYNPYLGLMGTFRLVAHALPVHAVALLLTMTSVSILGLAFWLAKGDREAYNAALLGWCYLIPGFTALLVLPGKQSAPPLAGFNVYMLLVCVTLTAFCTCLALRGWFWRMGQSTA